MSRVCKKLLLLRKLTSENSLNCIRKSSLRNDVGLGSGDWGLGPFSPLWATDAVRSDE